MIRHIIVGVAAGAAIPIAIVWGIGCELQQDDEIGGQGSADLWWRITGLGHGTSIVNIIKQPEQVRLLACQTWHTFKGLNNGNILESAYIIYLLWT